MKTYVDVVCDALTKAVVELKGWSLTSDDADRIQKLIDTLQQEVKVKRVDGK